jgi:hypothetical protein
VWFWCLFDLFKLCFSLPFSMPCNFFLIAGQDALNRRSCSEQTCNNVVVVWGERKYPAVLWVGEREYTAVLWAGLSLSGQDPLNHDLHKASQFFPAPWGRQVEMLELVFSLPPCGKVELTSIGYLPFPGSDGLWLNPSRLGLGSLVFPECGLW